MTRDEALSAILARPETHLPTACDEAAFAALAALENAGASDDEKAATLIAFADARTSLETELADLALLT